MELEDLIRTELSACAVAEQRYLLQGPAVRLHAEGRGIGRAGGA